MASVVIYTSSFIKTQDDGLHGMDELTGNGPLRESTKMEPWTYFEDVYLKFTGREKKKILMNESAAPQTGILKYGWKSLWKKTP